MTQWFRTQIVIPHTTGLPEDAVMNTWHWLTESAEDRDVCATDFALRLLAFYSGWVDDFGSSQYDWGHVAWKTIDFTDAKPRYPFAIGEIAPGSGHTAGYDLPAEVAVCLSMKAAVESGDNVRRKRGRIYVGPFTLPGPADQPRVGTDLIGSITDAFQTAFGEPDDSGTTVAVYSPYTHHAVPVGERLDPETMPEISDALPASFAPVVSFWCDNAWDTQRRRGVKATTRNTFDLGA